MALFGRASIRNLQGYPFAMLILSTAAFLAVPTFVDAAGRDAKKFVDYELTVHGSTPQQALSAKGCHAPITGAGGKFRLGAGGRMPKCHPRNPEFPSA